MYLFDHRGAVKSEAHRAICLWWLNGTCRAVASTANNSGELQREIDDLIEYLHQAPVLIQYLNPDDPVGEFRVELRPAPHPLSTA